MDGLFDAGIDAEIHRLMREWNVRGLAVAALRSSPPAGAGGETGTTREQSADEGEWAGVRCYGEARDGVAVTPQTMFPLFSLSKLFVVLVLLPLLREHGHSLDTPVQSLIPGFEMADSESTRRATIGDLLAHTTGLSYASWHYSAKCNTLDGVLETIKHIPVLEYGAHSYSDIAYDLAAHLAEILAGKPFQQLTQERILGPLGMEHTGFGGRAGVPSDTGDDKLAMGHQPVRTSQGLAEGVTTSEGWGDVGLASLGEHVAQGAMGLHSSAQDMITWLRLLTSNPDYTQANLPRVHANMPNFIGPRLLHQSTPGGSSTQPTYGLAMWQDRLLLDDTPIELHWGNQSGYVAYLARLPGHGISLVVLGNATEAREMAPWVLMRLLHTKLGSLDRMRDVEDILVQDRAERHGGTKAHRGLHVRGRLPKPHERLQGAYAGPNDSTWTFDETTYVEALPARTNLPILPWLRGSVRPVVTIDEEGRYQGCLRYRCSLTGREAVGWRWVGVVVQGENHDMEGRRLRVLTPEPYEIVQRRD